VTSPLKHQDPEKGGGEEEDIQLDDCDDEEVEEEEEETEHYPEEEEDDDDDDDESESIYSSQATFGHACGIWFNPTVDIISNDLRDLPKGRRELVWSDMIGNDSNVDHFERGIKTESPETVASSLQELQKELGSMFSFGDTALRRARVQCPQYVDDPEFRLRFLRSERFHVKNAANRLLRHFEEKKFLFGEQCLGRDVRLSDLNDDDLQCLRCGGLQVTSIVDRHGRPVEVTNYHLLQNNPVASRISEVRQHGLNEWNAILLRRRYIIIDFAISFFLSLSLSLTPNAFHTSPAPTQSHSTQIFWQNRARWYTLMTACEDVSVQQNGIVRVIDALHDYTSQAGKKFDAEYFKMVRHKMKWFLCVCVCVCVFVFVCVFCILYFVFFSVRSFSLTVSMIVSTHTKHARTQKQKMRAYHAIPVKFVATYVVIDDDSWKPVLEQFLRFMPMDWRVRTRVLKGSYDECCYDLLCVGVPKGVLTVGTQNHTEWLEQRQEIEGVKRRRM
jgi:hypothetical protein